MCRNICIENMLTKSLPPIFIPVRVTTRKLKGKTHYTTNNIYGKLPQNKKNYKYITVTHI